MQPLVLLEFDITGKNPANKQTNKIMLKDKTLPYVVPYAAPFFKNNFVVKDDEGRILNAGYTFEEPVIDVQMDTGKEVYSFIKLNQNLIDNNDFVTVTYQSVGLTEISRDVVMDFLEQLEIGLGKPIPWGKLFRVPDAFPFEHHIHSIKTELAGFVEICDILDILIGFYQKYKTQNPMTNQVEVPLTNLFARLNTIRTTLMNNIKAHDTNYNNPHGIDKAGIKLGNHPNYKTATLAEDIAGIRTDVLSTPLGQGTALEVLKQDTGDLMEGGVLPFTQYGNNSYLPPAVQGAFEGLGTDIFTAGICLENTDELVILSRRFDGVNLGLYYSFVKNYSQLKNGAEFDVSFTGENYVHPMITQRRLVDEHVVRETLVKETVVIPGDGEPVIQKANAEFVWVLLNLRWIPDMSTYDPQLQYDNGGQGSFYINQYVQPDNPSPGGSWTVGYRPATGVKILYKRKAYHTKYGEWLTFWVYTTISDTSRKDFWIIAGGTGTNLGEGLNFWNFSRGWGGGYGGRSSRPWPAIHYNGKPRDLGSVNNFDFIRFVDDEWTWCGQREIITGYKRTWPTQNFIYTRPSGGGGSGGGSGGGGGGQGNGGGGSEQGIAWTYNPGGPYGQSTIVGGLYGNYRNKWIVGKRISRYPKLTAEQLASNTFLAAERELSVDGNKPPSVKGRVDFIPGTGAEGVDTFVHYIDDWYWLGDGKEVITQAETREVEINKRYIEVIQVEKDVPVPPDYIIRGSGGDVIMYGRATANDWWVTLGNGTFDPDMHNPVKVTPPAEFNRETSTIHLLGAWVYLCVTGKDPNDFLSFYRLPLANIVNGTPSTFVPVTTQITNLDGTTPVRGQHAYPSVKQMSGGLISRYFVNFSPAVNKANVVGFPQITTSPGSTSSKFYIKLHYRLEVAALSVDNFWRDDLHRSVVYELDTTNGVMVLTPGTVNPLTFNYTSNSVSPELGASVLPGVRFMRGQSCVLLPNGDQVSVGFDDYVALPMGIDVAKLGSNPTASNRVLGDVNNFPNGYKLHGVEPIVSPLLSGVNNTLPVYTAAGEYYASSVNKDRKMFFRNVLGLQEIRPNVTNLNFIIRSRELTSNITEVAADPRTGMVTVTRPLVNNLTQSWSTFGVGDNVFGYGPDGMTKKVDGGIMLPAQLNLSNGKYRLTSNQRTFYPADKIKELFFALVGDTSKYRAVNPGCLIMDSKGSPFPWLNHVAQFTYNDPASPTEYYIGIVIFSTTGVTRPGTGIVDVTSVSVIATSESPMPTRAVVDPVTKGLIYDYPLTSQQTQVIRINSMTDKPQHLVYSGFGVKTVEGFKQSFSKFVLTTDNQFDLAEHRSCSHYWDEYAQTLNDNNDNFLPAKDQQWKAGLAATIFTDPAGNHYNGVSVYPGNTWGLYFRSVEPFNVNGVAYELPIGMIDLRDVVSNPANMTFHLYVTVKGNKAKYIVSPTALQDGVALQRISTFITDANGIALLPLSKPFAINGKVLSEERVGGAIPVKGGNLFDTTELIWPLPGEFK